MKCNNSKNHKKRKVMKVTHDSDPISSVTFSSKNSEEPQSDQAKAVSQKDLQEIKGNPHIGDYNKAPVYMKDNHSITHGYRINFNNPRKILRSLFMLHNESVNIWTHFVPAIIIVACLCYFVIGPATITSTFANYSQKFLNGIDQYSHALDNLTLLAEYEKFKETTASELEQVKTNVFKSYINFRTEILTITESFKNEVSHLSTTFTKEIGEIQQNLKDKMADNLNNFEKFKLDFEKILAPMLINEFNQHFNGTYLSELKEKFNQFRVSIDSDLFEYLEFSKTPNPHQVSRWPIGVFLLSALTCLTCSTLFHLFYPMSSKSYTLFNRFDYAGINVLISGSAFPPLYYGMYCNIDLAIIYLTYTMLCAFSLFVLCLFEWIHRPENVNYKAFFFGGFGISLAIPLTHMLINEMVFDNYGDPFVFSPSFPYYLLLGFSYLFGLYVYTKRCPERNHPGKFNLCGHSHQIWHCFVVLGIIFTYLGALENLNMRKVSVCPA